MDTADQLAVWRKGRLGQENGPSHCSIFDDLASVMVSAYLEKPGVKFFYYQRLGCPGSHFNYCGHPVSRQRNTLAWARLDLDLNSATALIEEIQSDWIRDVVWPEAGLPGV